MICLQRKRISFASWLSKNLPALIVGLFASVTFGETKSIFAVLCILEFTKFFKRRYMHLIYNKVCSYSVVENSLRAPQGIRVQREEYGGMR